MMEDRNNQGNTSYYNQRNTFCLHERHMSRLSLGQAKISVSAALSDFTTSMLRLSFI